MNKHAYKSHWNNALQTWVAVPETAIAHTQTNAQSADSSSSPSRFVVLLQAIRKTLKTSMAAWGLAALSVLSMGAYAQTSPYYTIEWVGGSSTNWQDPNNWKDKATGANRLPIWNKDIAFFNGGTTSIVNNVVNTLVAMEIKVSGGGQLIAEKGLLAARDHIIIGEYGNGSLVIKDGAVVMSQLNTVLLGQTENSAGTVTVHSGGELRMQGGSYVGNKDYGSIYVNSGGLLHASGWAHILGYKEGG